jgi:chromosome segregation ATPase
MYLLLIGAVTILALDAAELISLGIVSGVMGLKVMKAEDFTKMTTSFETQLAEAEKRHTELLGERGGLMNQVSQLTEESKNLRQAGDEKQNQINAVTGERDALTGERDALKKQLDDLIAERDKLEQAMVEKTAEAEVQSDTTTATATTEKAAGRV